MLVLLRADVVKLGKTGEVVKVKDGYGRNYLIPQELAYPATDKFKNVLKEETKAETRKLNKLKGEAEVLKSNIDGKVFTITANVGEEDKLFGSITSQNIADAAKAQGFDIDKKRIVLEESIRTIGEHSVKYKLHPEVAIEFKISVVKE